MSNVDSRIDLEAHELLWLERCEQADQAFVRTRFDEASQCWSEAFELAKTFGEGDPRYVGSFNNLGIATRLNRDLESAEACYRQAQALWANCAQWVERMRPASQARSSVFHLRMERRHAHDYRRPLLEQYKTRLRAGAAATLNNLAEVLRCQGQTEDAHSLHAEALDARTAAGLAQDPGLAVIRANLNEQRLEGDAIPDNPTGLVSTLSAFRRQAEGVRWLVDRPPVFTDDGRLMAALLCAQLVGHAALRPSGG